MALIYDEPIDDTFSVCVAGENTEYYMYLYKTGFRGTVYDSKRIVRNDTNPLFCEEQAWKQWGIDKALLVH
jgi:hypothetical protein